MADNAVEEPTPLYKDFDEGTDYVPPIRIKVCGREYELPGDPPAGPILMGMKQGMRIEEDTAEMVRFLELMIGGARLNQMIEDGLGIKQLNMVADYITKQYGFDTDEDDAAPKAQAPRHVRRSKTSSKNGASSKRTSGGSTASVSRI